MNAVLSFLSSSCPPAESARGDELNGPRMDADESGRDCSDDDDDPLTVLLVWGVWSGLDRGRGVAGGGGPVRVRAGRGMVGG